MSIWKSNMWYSQFRLLEIGIQNCDKTNQMLKHQNQTEIRIAIASGESNLARTIDRSVCIPPFILFWRWNVDTLKTHLGTKNKKSRFDTRGIFITFIVLSFWFRSIYADSNITYYETTVKVMQK